MKFVLTVDEFYNKCDCFLFNTAFYKHVYNLTKLTKPTWSAFASRICNIICITCVIYYN
jgi:hypothetical protein